MPEGGVEWKPHSSFLRLEETLRLCSLLCELGVRRVKLTGGEPLLQKNLEWFLRALHRIPSLEQVTLTTNGLLLADFLGRLGDGAPSLLAGINISLNTNDPAIFAKMARRSELLAVLDGLGRAKSMGIPVKINCVPVRHHNESTLVDLAGLAANEVLAVRFIELMPMGVATGLEGIPTDEIMALIESRFGRLSPDDAKIGNGPAVYYSLPNFKGKIGFISAMSHGFCSSCTRLRLGSDGFLKPCLASDTGLDLKPLVRSGASDDEIKEAMGRLAASKPTGHLFAGSAKPGPNDEDRTYKGPVGMYGIGG
jgi:cyclic pyranopterin phosphate synthase